jgi:NHLM bacteriocin system ABC transporter peptidase/ATP-binding protein
MTTATRPRPPVTRQVRTPTVLQMEAVECGAAALAMVLAYYGRYVPLEELRIACGVARDGSKAINVLRAARQYGLDAKGMQAEVSALADVRPPAILFWKFNHFVVWEGNGRRFGRRMVYLNDPGSGRRAVTAEDFDGSFTGVVLTFKPGTGFTPGGRRHRPLGDVGSRLSGMRRSLALILAASLLLVTLGVTTPAFTRIFVDSVQFGNDRSVLTPLFLSMTVVMLTTVALTWLQQANLLRVQALMSTLGSARFLRHLLRLPFRFFTQRTSADIARRLKSQDTVAEILSRDVGAVAVNAVLVVLYAGLLWSYDAELTVVGVAMAMLNIAALRWVSKLRADAVGKLRADRASLVSTSFSGLQLIETMKATGSENAYFRRWSGFQAKVVSGQQKLGAPAAVLSVAAPLLATSNSALILLVGGLRAVEGHISIGLLVAFQTLITNFTRPVAQLTSLGPRIQDLAADVTRLRDVEAFPPAAIFDRPDPPGGSRLHGNLEFDRVTFGYNPLDEPLLRDFSFVIAPGQRIALVGSSGSGKSTVSRLVAGLYEPAAGEIRFDGRRREEIPRGIMAASVCFVDQEIFLFEGTVRQNVTLWDPSIPDEAIVAALKDAMIYDVVAARPGGIDGFVAEDGRNFSGGQRQRLEIARALVRSPSVLVLDEATSALDAETELMIDENLRRRGCACVVIAHRLSTIRDSDEILVLRYGTVVQRGRHEDMIATEGPYADLLREE